MSISKFRLAQTLALITGLIAGTAASAGPINSLGVAVTENFNTLAATGTSSTLPADWAFSEAGTNGNTTYTAGTGSSATGDTYSFGTGADRALGGLQSGTLIPTIGVQYTNATGSTITSLLISYFGEQWRLGATGRADQLDFQYSLNATALTTGTWVDFDALDFVAPNSVGTVGALDGNLAANRVSKSGTINSLTIANGATFWLRWNSFDATGADDGLAIDDFSLTVNGTAGTLPEPGTLALAGLALLGMARLRRAR